MNIQDSTTARYQESQGNQFVSRSSGISLDKGQDDKLKEACYDFESLFIKQMLDSMRKTVHKSTVMGERNQGEDIFEDMLYSEYAKKMSKQADLGIAKSLMNQFISK